MAGQSVVFISWSNGPMIYAYTFYSDEGETALNGSLLVAPYGKGNYILYG